MRTMFLSVAASLGLLSACATGNLPPAPSATPATSYKLGPGDVLRVTVYGENNLTGEYRVSPANSVDLPLVGIVDATDLSIEQFGPKVQEAFRSKQLLTNPRVAAEVLIYRPFFIQGEVNKPGQYPFIPGMTVDQAVATAGGYTYRARKDSAKITHSGQSSQTLYRLQPGAIVSPGDTIIVPERHF